MAVTDSKSEKTIVELLAPLDVQCYGGSGGAASDSSRESGRLRVDAGVSIPAGFETEETGGWSVHPVVLVILGFAVAWVVFVAWLVARAADS